MRARVRKSQPTIGIQCQRCRETRYYNSAREIGACRCGSVVGVFVMGRVNYEDLSDGKEEERVAAYRAAMRARAQGGTPLGRRRIKIVLTKGKGQMAKFKIVKRNPEAAAAKTAQPGSARTGAKVEKVKAGRRAGAESGVPGRFTGRTSGLSVAKFQNKTIEENRKRHLSDAELVRLWKSEFPNAKSDYTEAIVKGVRSLYNRGKHGNADNPPRVPVPEYDADGNPLPFRGEKAAAKREALEERQAARKAAKKKSKK